MTDLAKNDLAELFAREAALDPATDGAEIGEIRTAIRERYSKYTYAQLNDAYMNVSKEAYPERAAMLQELIAEHARNGARPPGSATTSEGRQFPESVRVAATCLLVGSLALIVLARQWLMRTEHHALFMLLCGATLCFWGVVHRDTPGLYAGYPKLIHPGYRALISGIILLFFGLVGLVQQPVK